MASVFGSSTPPFTSAPPTREPLLYCDHVTALELCLYHHAHKNLVKTEGLCRTALQLKPDHPDM